MIVQSPRGYEEVVALAKEMGVPTKVLLAMSRDNDPFAIGTEAHVKWGKWFAKLWERFGFPRGTHLRRAHYVLVSQKKPGQAARWW